MCRRARSGEEGGVARGWPLSTKCVAGASGYPLPWWVAEYRPYRRHRWNNYTCHRGRRVSSCVLFLLLFSTSILSPFSCFCDWMTHSLLCIFPIESSFWSLSIPSFLSFQTGDSHRLCISCLRSPCYLSVVLITKRWSPIELINPEWTPRNRRLMKEEGGGGLLVPLLSPRWQLLLRRNILMAPLSN